MNAVLVVVVVAAGFALITGPIWVRMARELNLERRERIRAQERSELAAHLHDSVLQTLALIQRNADAPREVARLARGQERELRTLLYGDRAASGRFATAVRDAAAEVEDSYGLHVDAVVVGDAALDADLQALVQAAREAMVNAAKHAEVDVDRCVRRGRPARGVALRPRPRSRVRSGARCPMIGRACAAPSASGWNATAAPYDCAVPPARERRSRCA